MARKKNLCGVHASKRESERERKEEEVKSVKRTFTISLRFDLVSSFALPLFLCVGPHICLLIISSKTPARGKDEEQA